MEEEPFESSILYENSSRTVFLIDIPTSIALSQQLSSLQQQQPSSSSSLRSGSNYNNDDDKKEKKKKPSGYHHLLSSPPRKSPFPASTEPKSDATRRRVSERIPVSERIYHGFIEGIVRGGLRDVSGGYYHYCCRQDRDQGQMPGRDWCLPRRVIEDDDSHPRLASRKRKRWVDGDDARSRISSMNATAATASTVPLLRDDFEPPVILSTTCSNVFENVEDFCATVVKNPSSSMATVTVLSAGGGPEVHRNDTTSATATRNLNGDDRTNDDEYRRCTFNIPPGSNFILCTLPLERRGPQEPDSEGFACIIPGLGLPSTTTTATERFNLILLDPPWPNRSVRRSRHYSTHSYTKTDMDDLSRYLRDILRVYLYNPGDSHGDGDHPSRTTMHDNVPRIKSQQAIAAVWVTNSEKSRRAAHEAFHSAGLYICEEWIWIKTTKTGEPITPLDGLWRKPYEILIIGKRGGQRRSHCPHRGWVYVSNETGNTTTSNRNSAKDDDDDEHITRRVIAAVPDIHSRKPNLREIFERVFFASDDDAAPGPRVKMSYSALEVFARNLTAGWWACGDDVLRFNSKRWWVD